MRVELVPTGWNVKPAREGAVPSDGDGEEPDPGTYWHPLVTDPNIHKVWVGTNTESLAPVTPELLIQELVEMGILKV